MQCLDPHPSLAIMQQNNIYTTHLQTSLLRQKIDEKNFVCIVLSSEYKV